MMAENMAEAAGATDGSFATSPEGVFTVGQRVIWNGSAGTVRYVGEVSFDKGDWIGVALDKPEGMHNGTVFGKTYFHCASRCGILSPPSGLQRLDDGSVAPTTGDDWAESAEWYEGYMAGLGKGKGSFKSGDWECPSCGFHNFSRNVVCRACQTPNPYPAMGMEGKAGKAALPGDWQCENCGFHNFARNAQCKACGWTRPNTVLAVETAKGGGKWAKPGDWECPSCGYLNFARNGHCKACSEPRPFSLETADFGGDGTGEGDGLGMSKGKGKKYGGLREPPEWSKPGDWICPNPECQDLQFARNEFCRRCGTANPNPPPPKGSKGKGGGGGVLGADQLALLQASGLGAGSAVALQAQLQAAQLQQAGLSAASAAQLQAAAGGLDATTAAALQTAQLQQMMQAQAVVMQQAQLAQQMQALQALHVAQAAEQAGATAAAGGGAEAAAMAATGLTAQIENGAAEQQQQLQQQDGAPRERSRSPRQAGATE